MGFHLLRHAWQDDAKPRHASQHEDLVYLVGGQAIERGLHRARTVATLRGWEATVAIGLDPVGSATTSIVGAADAEVVSAQVSVSLTFSDFARAQLRDWLRLGSTYTWVLPLEGGELAGAALIIPSAYVSELPGDTVEDERSYSTCTLSAASSEFVGTSGTPTAANGAYFLLAFCS